MRDDGKGSWKLTLVLMLSALGVARLGGAVEPFLLKSSTFADGTLMPKKVSNDGKAMQNPNCVGENVSPQLSWSNAPEGTKSFALIMTDPEGRSGVGVIHWLAYGIEPSVTNFAEGEVTKDSDRYIGGKSTLGVGHYSGPCTPPGAPHHYTFIVIATDLDPKELPPGLSLPDFQARLAGHAKGAAALIGLFKNPY